MEALVTSQESCDAVCRRIVDSCLSAEKPLRIITGFGVSGLKVLGFGRGAPVKVIFGYPRKRVVVVVGLVL